MKAEPGIRRTRSGWQVYVRIDGEFRSKHYPPNTGLVTLRRWREAQLARKTLGLPDDPNASTFGHDARTYLATIPADMTTYAGRKQHIDRWVSYFGATSNRQTITAADIRRALEHWRKTVPYAPATLNLLRTALGHLYSVLDGKSAKNPVRDVPRYHEPAKRLLLPTWEEARAAVEGVTSPLYKLRLTVLRLTGWPSAQLKRVTQADIHPTSPEVYLEGRRKGKGRDGLLMPVVPQAHAALLKLAAANALGTFWNSECHRELMKSIDRLKLKRFRVYDLRHRFLTTAALAIRDDAVIQALALHANRTMTHRYIEQAVDPRVRAGLDMLAVYLTEHHGEDVATFATPESAGVRSRPAATSKA